MREIRIDAPGAGDWIMQRAGGVFTPSHDHSFATFRDGRIVGGFALCSYLVASMTIHAAGSDEKWCSRDLLWMVFDYAFCQLGLHKLIAPVPSSNTRALKVDLQAGFIVEALITHAAADGDLMLLTMTREQCRWLAITPRRWRVGSLKVA